MTCKQRIPIKSETLISILEKGGVGNECSEAAASILGRLYNAQEGMGIREKGMIRASDLPKHWFIPEAEVTNKIAERARKAIKKWLSSEKIYRQSEGIKLLGKLRDKGSIQLIQNKMHDVAVSYSTYVEEHREYSVNEFLSTCAGTLASINTREAAEALIWEYANPPESGTLTPECYRSFLKSGLKKLSKNASAVEPLVIAAVNNNPKLRRAATEVLAEMSEYSCETPKEHFFLAGTRVDYVVPKEVDLMNKQGMERALREHAFPVLMERIDSEKDSESRNNILKVVAGLGVRFEDIDDVITVMLKLKPFLKGEDEDARKAIVKGLISSVDDPDGVSSLNREIIFKELRDRLGDHSLDIRSSAAAFFARRENRYPGALEKLKPLLTDPTPGSSIHSHAADAIENIGDEPAIKAFMDALEELKAGADRYGWMREYLIRGSIVGLSNLVNNPDIKYDPGVNPCFYAIS